jgi:hypothetical protein
VVKPVLIQLSPSPDFHRRFLKNEREISPPFFRTGPEKSVETGEGGVGPKKTSSPTTPVSPLSPPFFRSL